MEYDSANRLVRVKADDNQTVLASYTYSDSNQRLISDEGGARTYYAAEGGTVLCEYVEYGGQTLPQWSKSYVHLGGRLLATVEAGSTAEVVQYHHPDRLGTRLITAAGNASFSEQSTLPYGTVLGAETTAQTSRRFTSYDRSPATGLDYAVNRRYDPLQGRFTQVDPIEMDAVDLGDPQTLNLYSYCANDPVNSTDPDGLFIKRLFKAIWKVLTNKWFMLAVTVALTVISVGAAAGLWSLTTTVMQTAVVHGYTISLGAPQVSALGWVAAGLSTALAIPGLTSLKGLLRNAVSFGIGQAVGSLGVAGGGFGTPDWNPDANDFARRRDRRPPLRRGQRGYRGPGSWHYGLGWHRPRIPISRQLLPGKHVKHHLFPQRADLASEFARRGIDIHQYTMVLPENVHQRLHRGGPRGGMWNQEWESFFRENPNATREQVFRHAGALIHRHGLVQPYPIVPYR